MSLRLLVTGTALEKKAKYERAETFSTFRLKGGRRGEKPIVPSMSSTTWPSTGLTNIEKYLNSARDELASDPCDERLRAFIAVVEGLAREEKAKLG